MIFSVYSLLLNKKKVYFSLLFIYFLEISFIYFSEIYLTLHLSLLEKSIYTNSAHWRVIWIVKIAKRRIFNISFIGVDGKVCAFWGDRPKFDLAFCRAGPGPGPRGPTQLHGLRGV